MKNEVDKHERVPNDEIITISRTQLSKAIIEALYLGKSHGCLGIRNVAEHFCECENYEVNDKYASDEDTYSHGSDDALSLIIRYSKKLCEQRFANDNEAASALIDQLECRKISEVADR